MYNYTENIYYEKKKKRKIYEWTCEKKKKTSKRINNFSLLIFLIRGKKKLINICTKKFVNKSRNKFHEKRYYEI